MRDLLELGVSLRAKDASGDAPIHLAASLGHVPIALCWTRARRRINPTGMGVCRYIWRVPRVTTLVFVPSWRRMHALDTVTLTGALLISPRGSAMSG